MKIFKDNKARLKVKRTFLKKGTCSRTFFYILNEEFGYPKENEECAIDPMAGGIVQQGYQCGILWGASMAIGAECYRRFGNTEKAVAVAIQATRHIMNSFKNMAKSIECQDITETDFSNKWSFAKYVFTGKFYSCFKLSEKWAPEAIKSATEGVSANYENLPNHSVSCASETIKRMGATDEEAIMAAGFAGGLGLSGSGCGALSAVIWYKTLQKVKKGNYKSTISDPDIDSIINIFYKATDYEMECSRITKKEFKDIDEHSEFIQSGGCENVIKALVQS